MGEFIDRSIDDDPYYNPAYFNGKEWTTLLSEEEWYRFRPNMPWPNSVSECHSSPLFESLRNLKRLQPKFDVFKNDSMVKTGVLSWDGFNWWTTLNEVDWNMVRPNKPWPNKIAAEEWADRVILEAQPKEKNLAPIRNNWRSKGYRQDATLIPWKSKGRTFWGKLRSMKRKIKIIILRLITRPRTSLNVVETITPIEYDNSWKSNGRKDHWFSEL